MDAAENRAGRAAVKGAASGIAALPPEAIQWLVGSGPTRMLELGAAAGGLTRVLCDLGHDVVAADPTPASMLTLRRAAPKAHRVLARAEDLPVSAGAVDIVVASSYDTLDSERALPEVARVLRPGGVFAVVRRAGDHKVPWVRKVSALIGETPPPEGDDPFEFSDIVTLAERRSFRQWQRFFRPTLVGFVAASARAAAMSPDDREALLAEAGELYDSYDRGPDGLLMPWIVECLRARVKGAAAVVTADAADDGLLIDFS